MQETGAGIYEGEIMLSPCSRGSFFLSLRPGLICSALKSGRPPSFILSDTRRGRTDDARQQRGHMPRISASRPKLLDDHRLFPAQIV